MKLKKNHTMILKNRQNFILLLFSGLFFQTKGTCRYHRGAVKGKYSRVVAVDNTHGRLSNRPYSSSERMKSEMRRLWCNSPWHHRSVRPVFVGGVRAGVPRGE